MMWGSRKPTILVKGTLADRPWAIALVAIGAAGHSGQLTLEADGKVYRLAFAKGRLVGAESPAPCDTLQRIALASHAMPPASVAAATRIVGRSDDVTKFTESSGLVGHEAVQFKRRVILQRAARTFAAERGDYALSDRVTIPVVTGMEVDVCAAIYRGMRAHLSDLRLTADLRKLGARFLLFPEAMEHVARFDFDPEVDLIIGALREGTSAPEIEARFRSLDPRLIYAVLGALASSSVITSIDGRAPTTEDISIARTPTPREPTVSRVPTPRQPTVSSSTPVSLQQQAPRFAAGSHPRIVREFDNALTHVRSSGLSREQIEDLLVSRMAMLEAGADLFTFLGVPFDAPVAHVRTAYLELARYLRPDRLMQFGICDRQHEARTVFAQAVVAMTVLTDDTRRADYLASMIAPHRA